MTHILNELIDRKTRDAEVELKHFLYIPWTGLGLYKGFRGNAWLANRIKIFKQFVVPSLRNQTNKNFVVWCSWRPEERHNHLVKELRTYLAGIKDFRTVFTFNGVCFWDDKYPDPVAYDRLITALHGSMQEMVNETSECKNVIMTIQPSDDCYIDTMVEEVQTKLVDDVTAVGYRKGYIMAYQTGELAEYNPLTIPPFFSIKFPREIFIDPKKHVDYTGPYKSHEYIGQKLKFAPLDGRGFLVGTHGENISTVYNHPFKGRVIEDDEKVATLLEFGLYGVPELKIKYPTWKKIYKKLPHRVQRKLRYIFGEKFWAKLYG